MAYQGHPTFAVPQGQQQQAPVAPYPPNQPPGGPSRPPEQSQSAAMAPPRVTPPPSSSVVTAPHLKIEDDVLVTRTPDEETEDGRVRNREAAAKIRDAWIYKQVRARRDEFTQYRQASTVEKV